MRDIYSMLNEQQREAVFHTEGPLLILAGAGAGKTRVLTHRIAYLIEEKHVAPWNIMAITFTNKAAEEMKNRVEDMVEYGDSVWVSTFHSSCVRMLRRYIDRLGYDSDFTIYDTDDQKTLLRHIIKDLDLDPKMFKEKALASYISDCKNSMRFPEDEAREASGNFRDTQYARIYQEYQVRLKKNNALDFDDLLLLMVQLLKQDAQVLEYYQNRFQYILVDEYQDTNHVQFELIYLLAKGHRNICVVGDDDQSIYRFRGADIRNILDFEAHFPGTKVVKLEQNYRSTGNILDCANAVIQNNRGRKEKKLWSDLGDGTPVEFRFYDNGYEEAEEVIRRIRREVMEGASFSDYAVLYRTNAQSRTFEEKCISFNIPYRMVGGVNFYQRAEIKDLLAYLKVVAGGRDDLAVQRILNVPKRGIGQATVDKLLAYAGKHDISLMQAIRTAAANAGLVPGVDRAQKKLAAFAHLMGELSGDMYEMGFDELIRTIIEKTDYYSTLDELDEEKAEQKKENIEEMISKARDFMDHWDGEEEPELADFLEEVALVADIDNVDSDGDKIMLMTLHGSKGLEFEKVFLVGMEEGLFPSFMSMESGDPMDIEEERRLCYVGITRAKRHLMLSGAKCRTVRGEIQYNKVSRFIEEIPDEMIGLSRSVQKKFTSKADNGYFGSGFTSSGMGTSGKLAGGYNQQAYKPAPKASFGKTFTVERTTSLDFGIGDRVHHTKFGDGTVTQIADGKQDLQITVHFDDCGDKIMLASFAKKMMKKI